MELDFTGAVERWEVLYEASFVPEVDRAWTDEGGDPLVLSLL
jgi:hypothetical protein